MKFKVGDLIKYYELYGDVYIVKSAGYGIITEKKECNHGDEITLVYTVLAKGKKYYLESHQIEKV